MLTNMKTLATIGWEPFFQQQLSTEEWETTTPFRVTAVHRGQLQLSCGEYDIALPVTGNMLTEDKMKQATIGDWLLISDMNSRFSRLLDRKSLFKRKAPGTTNDYQLIAANVNTLFIVMSCNNDFNVSRLERYLALAYEAEVEPVIILTKADLVENAADYANDVRQIDPMLMVETINAHDLSDLERLEPWCRVGQTIALMGSSGVGKSTIANGLGTPQQKTGSIRENDSKGRHTTTHRSLLSLKHGAILMDSPGMRELQIADSKKGVDAAFSEVLEIANRCRYKDCEHDQEPGCAVKKAIEDGVLDSRRLSNYKKLKTEQARNSETLAQRRKKERDLGKYYKKSLKDAYRFKGIE